MEVVTAYRKLLRSGLNNPGNFERRMSEMCRVLEREATGHDESLAELCADLGEATLEEIERFERNQADNSGRGASVFRGLVSAVLQNGG